MHNAQPATGRELDLITGVLTGAGLNQVTTEHTGGGVMVVTGWAGHGVDTVVATVEDLPLPESHDPTTYMLGIYPGITWHEGAGEDAVHRTATGLDNLGALARDAVALLDRDPDVLDLIGWQHETYPVSGHLDIPVPGGIIRVRLDTGGVHGAFHLTGEVGHVTTPSIHPDLGRTLTFTGAGPWDVDRIVAVLRAPDHPGHDQILADYPS